MDLFQQAFRGGASWWIWSCEGAHGRHVDGSGSAYEVRRFRREFEIAGGEGAARLVISADSRYELYLDGRLLGRGPAHGDVRHQYFDNYELGELVLGRHLLAVRVFDYSPVQCDPPRLGAPAAVMSRTGGLAVELWLEGDEGTRRLVVTDGAWKVAVDRSFGFHPGREEWFGGFVGLFEEYLPHRDDAPGWAEPGFDDSGWEDAFAMYPAERFEDKTDATSPYGLMLRITPHVRDGNPVVPAAVFLEGGGRAAANWEEFFMCGNAMTVEPHSTASVLIEWEMEWTGFPKLCFAGGAGSELRIGCAEGLRASKGDREVVVFGREADTGDVMIGYDDTGMGWTFDRRGSFEGFEDILRPDGREWTWSPHHWRCGKFLRLWVQTGGEPLRLGGFWFTPCHYPLEESAPFLCSDERITRVHEIGLHTLRLGMHETFLDCPYYEQFQYIGDSSLNAQVAMMAGGAYDIVRQLVLHFDWSRVPEGWTQSRYPSRIEGIIPSQSLDWITAIHAYALHSGDLETARMVWPGALAVLDAYERHCGPGGLPEKLPYWNWIDWCPGWKRGVPPGAEDGPVLSHAAKYAIALRQAAQVARWIGEPDAIKSLEARYLRVSRAARAAFWNGKFFAENMSDRSYGSRLGNALAVSAGFVEESQEAAVRQALVGRKLSDCSFFGYYFVRQALWQLGGCDLRMELAPWFEMLNYGLTTWAEDTSYWRSLCHGWSSNPSIDFFTRVLGVTPLEPGFGTARVQPAIGHFRSFSGAVATPHGAIRVAWDATCGQLDVVVPPGVSARLDLEDPGVDCMLGEGRHSIAARQSGVDQSSEVFV